MARRAAKVELTDRFLRSLKNKTHPAEPPLVFIYDGVCPGLNVLWTTTGHLSFGMTKRWPGKVSPTWRALGAVYLPPKEPKKASPAPAGDEITGGALTLAEARAKARRWLERLDRGIDPVHEAKQQRREAVQRITFAALREEHIKRHWRAGKLRKADEAERLLKKEFAAWDARPAADITGDDVDEVITAIVDRGAVGQARNVFAYLRGLYSWALGNRRYRIRTSPCDGFSPTKMFGEKPTGTRWLKDDELRAVWAAAPVLGHAAPVLKLLIVTACRLNEIAGLRREEIGEEEIVIPAARMKPKVDFLVPITPGIRKIVDALPKQDGPCVFSTTDGRVPMTIGSKLKNKLDEAVRKGRRDAGLPDIAPWTWHDLRRTARTNFSKLSISEEVREALLAHIKKGITKNYDLHDYAQEKRDALMKWEAALARILIPPVPTVEDFAEHARRAVS
jgi:integrase